METSRQFKRDAFKGLYGPAAGMRPAGAFKKAARGERHAPALPPELTPAQVRALRESQGVSRPVFARYLNTSASAVAKWEDGTNRPHGMALKLLALVQQHGLAILG